MRQLCMCRSFLKQVTYVLEGMAAHEDFCGHSGQLKPGDLQVLQNYMLIVFYNDFTIFLKCFFKGILQHSGNDAHSLSAEG